MPVRLVVVAAHPDDETVGAASLLLRAHDAAVVHLTDGAPRDPRLWGVAAPDRASYAALRRAEARAALAEAGVTSERIFALGAVDQEAVEVLAPLARELAAVLDALEPRLVVSHPLEGGHPDHDAAALAVRAAVALLAQRGARPPRLAEMTSYHLEEGALATGRFLPGSPRGIRHRLTPAEREVKRRMIECHASQRRVLAMFRLDEEAFRLAPPVSLAARPHPAPLHYEACGWMSFERFQEAALEALGALGLLGGEAAPAIDAAPPC